MRDLILAFSLIKVIRKSEWKYRQFKSEDIIKWFTLIWTNSEWEITTWSKIKNFSEEADKNGKRERKEFNKIIELQRKIYDHDFELREINSKHEAEIIRLKDIIQAKQVQLDKFVTDIQGE